MNSESIQNDLKAAACSKDFLAINFYLHNAQSKIQSLLQRLQTERKSYSSRLPNINYLQIQCFLTPKERKQNHLVCKNWLAAEQSNLTQYHIVEAKNIVKVQFQNLIHNLLPLSDVRGNNFIRFGENEILCERGIYNVFGELKGFLSIRPEFDWIRTSQRRICTAEVFSAGWSFRILDFDYRLLYSWRVSGSVHDFIITDDSVYVLQARCVIRYSLAGKKIFQFEIEDQDGIYYRHKKQDLVVFDEFSLSVYSLSGKLIKKWHFPKHTEGYIFFSEEFVLVPRYAELEIYNFDGHLAFKTDMMTKEICHVVVVDNHLCYFEEDRSFIVYQIKYR